MQSTKLKYDSNLHVFVFIWTTPYLQCLFILNSCDAGDPLPKFNDSNPFVPEVARLLDPLNLAPLVAHLSHMYYFRASKRPKFESQSLA